MPARVCTDSPSHVCELFPFLELIGVNNTGARTGGGDEWEHDNIRQNKKKKIKTHRRVAEMRKRVGGEPV